MQMRVKEKFKRSKMLFRMQRDPINIKIVIVSRKTRGVEIERQLLWPQTRVLSLTSYSNWTTRFTCSKISSTGSSLAISWATIWSWIKRRWTSQLSRVYMVIARSMVLEPLKSEMTPSMLTTKITLIRWHLPLRTKQGVDFLDKRLAQRLKYRLIRPRLCTRVRRKLAPPSNCPQLKIMKLPWKLVPRLWNAPKRPIRVSFRRWWARKTWLFYQIKQQTSRQGWRWSVLHQGLELYLRNLRRAML